jgi:hypothetical protein
MHRPRPTASIPQMQGYGVRLPAQRRNRPRRRDSCKTMTPKVTGGIQMRSTKLVPALAAVAATALALVPAGASAAGHAGAKHQARGPQDAVHNGRCRLGMTAAPRFLESGESAVVFGQLVCAGAAVPNQTVTVLQRTAGTPGQSTAGTATTDATGHYQLSTPVLLRNSIFYATAGAAHSPHRSVKVAPKVSLVGPPDGSQLFTGAGPLRQPGVPGARLRNVVTFTGKVSPVEAGAVVVLQRENAVASEEWHRIDLGVVDAAGNYSITHKFATPGDANVRVVVRPLRSHGHVTNAAAASEAISYEISQAQVPGLSIEVSADPISYGQPLTISGATAPGTPLTLLARTRSQAGFAPVASTVSTAGGSYTFPVQTPLQSTFYKVSAAGKTSATRFEGVKYLLTSAVSANTVQAGQPLTFSGTVTPAVAGHPVYLQARNPSGIGYHVVQVGTVNADGTYSIAHTTYSIAQSTRKFRVKVPGDPQNQGIAGPLLEVAVTSAPAGSLAPEPPANSSLPREGQL